MNEPRTLVGKKVAEALAVLTDADWSKHIRAIEDEAAAQALANDGDYAVIVLPDEPITLPLWEPTSSHLSVVRER